MQSPYDDSHSPSFSQPAEVAIEFEAMMQDSGLDLTPYTTPELKAAEALEADFKASQLWLQ